MSPSYRNHPQQVRLSNVLLGAVLVTAEWFSDRVRSARAARWIAD